MFAVTGSEAVDAAQLTVAGAVGLAAWKLFARATGRGLTRGQRILRAVETDLPARLDKVDSRLDAGDSRMATIEEHVCSIDSTMATHIEGEEGREAATTERLDRVEAGLTGVHERLDGMTTAIEAGDRVGRAAPGGAPQ